MNIKKSIPKPILLILAIVLVACIQQNQESQSPLENASLEEQLEYLNNKENFSSEILRLQALFEFYADNELQYLPPLGTFMGNHPDLPYLSKIKTLLIL